MTNTAISGSPTGCHGQGWRSQFGCPRGFLGWIVGHVMAWKNKERSKHVVSLLDLRPHDHVLEIGYGSGTDVQRVQQFVSKGNVTGIDRSEVMYRQASRRNAREIALGKVDLHMGTAESLPFADNKFSRVFSINTAQFWADPIGVMREIYRVLEPGGLAVIAVQPRSPIADAETSRDVRDILTHQMRLAGFSRVHGGLVPLKPTPVAYIQAYR